MEDEVDEITIEYKYKAKIKLFGNIFVKNNKNLCTIVFDLDELNLQEYIILSNEQTERFKHRIITIKLKGISKITNMEHMFSNCRNLLCLPDIDNWNTNKIINMNSLFRGCESLEYLPDKLDWNTSKVTDMSFMFFKCFSLKSLPNISNWDTNNVNDMSYMFDDCKLLKSLPDISNWNTENVNNMRSLFFRCESLLS